MVGRGSLLCGVVCLVWSGLVRYGMVWYGMVWYGMVWYGMVPCGPKHAMITLHIFIIFIQTFRMLAHQKTQQLLLLAFFWPLRSCSFSFVLSHRCSTMRQTGSGQQLLQQLQGRRQG